MAAAVSLILIAFGSAVGLAVASSSPTWRDASPALAVGSGLYLLLTAIVSFGLGGYVAGRLRERWHVSAHDDVVEFRDGTHGLVAWAVAVVITGLVAAASATSIASKAVQPTTSPSATTGKSLIAYELDRLFRAGPRPVQGDLTYTRAEAGRILLTASGHSGVCAGGPRLSGAVWLLRRPALPSPTPSAGSTTRFRGDHGAAEGAAERRDFCLCCRRCPVGRGCCGVVRVLPRRAAPRHRRATPLMALSATGLAESEPVPIRRCPNRA